MYGIWVYDRRAEQRKKGTAFVASRAVELADRYLGLSLTDEKYGHGMLRSEEGLRTNACYMYIYIYIYAAWTYQGTRKAASQVLGSLWVLVSGRVCLHLSVP